MYDASESINIALMEKPLSQSIFFESWFSKRLVDAIFCKVPS